MNAIHKALWDLGNKDPPVSSEHVGEEWKVEVQEKEECLLVIWNISRTLHSNFIYKTLPGVRQLLPQKPSTYLLKSQGSFFF